MLGAATRYPESVESCWTAEAGAGDVSVCVVATDAAGAAVTLVQARAWFHAAECRGGGVPGEWLGKVVDDDGRSPA